MLEYCHTRAPEIKLAHLITVLLHTVHTTFPSFSHLTYYLQAPFIIFHHPELSLPAPTRLRSLSLSTQI